MANEMEQYMRALLGSAQGKAAAQAAVRGDEADARASLAALLQTPDGAALLRALAALQGGR